MTLHLTINVVQHTGSGDVVINSGPQEQTQTFPFRRGSMTDEQVAWWLARIAEAQEEAGKPDK